jgi:hypothetical protein
MRLKSFSSCLGIVMMKDNDDSDQHENNKQRKNTTKKCCFFSRLAQARRSRYQVPGTLYLFKCWPSIPTHLIPSPGKENNSFFNKKNTTLVWTNTFPRSLHWISFVLKLRLLMILYRVGRNNVNSISWNVMYFSYLERSRRPFPEAARPPLPFD